MFGTKEADCGPGVVKAPGAVPVQTALWYVFVSIVMTLMCLNRRMWKDGRGRGERAYFAGQQAGWLLASREQTWPYWQQIPLKAAPWFEHE